MNLETKLKRIAEVCGWRFEGDFAYGPKGEYVGQLGFAFETWDELLPDYFSDLNAVARAEKSCEDTERYYCTLATVVSGKTCYKISEAHHEKVFVASAAQRAEAVLRYHEEFTD